MLNIDDRLLNELDESELYLVLHIAKHMKANRMTAWPSLETLSKACNWDDRTVKKHRQSLIKKGFLEMTMNPGKPTLYRFLKDGIGVYRPMKTDDLIAENEGTYIEGGTKNEGTQNAVKGVQKMRGVRGHKMYPEDIKGIKSEIIKEEGENAQNALTPPFRHAGTIELPETNIPLEAEKKENDFTGAGPTPPAELLVTTHTPQAPYMRVVERVEVPAPGPKSPGDKIRELCAADHRIREGFTISRKIPATRFDEYLQAFDAEQAAMPILKTYRNDNDLVSHFLNFSGVRWSVEQRATQARNGGRGAQLQNSGSDLSKYDQPQKF